MVSIHPSTLQKEHVIDTCTSGKTSNLAPYSYTQVINHDPPLFIVSQAGGIDNAKDSFKNLVESGECVINIVSEHYIEAANATSINAPYGISEWALTGLTPAPCSQVKASRVKEAIFAVECKLVEIKEFESRVTPGKKTSSLAILEGVRFWAREDAINEEKNIVDPAVCACAVSFLIYMNITDVLNRFSNLWPDLVALLTAGSPRLSRFRDLIGANRARMLRA